MSDDVALPEMITVNYAVQVIETCFLAGVSLIVCRDFILRRTPIHMVRQQLAGIGAIEADVPTVQ